MVTISKCQTAKELKLFEQLPERLHQKDPFFVPPYPGSISRIFSPKFPFNREGKLFPFIAYEDGQPVGRIAAVVNPAHNAYYNDKVGFFGFFDSVDRPEVAKALFARAEKELLDHGLSSARGPYNPTVNDECGLLVEGFDSCPLVMMPYNPPYYRELYEACGLAPVRNLSAFYISAYLEPPERIRKIVGRVQKKLNVTVRNIELARLEEELLTIRDLYNVTLDRNWGFVPITVEELQYAAADLKAIMNPELALIAEKDGKAIGFSLVIPNVNEFMWKARTSKGLMRILKFVWLLKTKRPKEARLAILGVTPEFRSKGVAPLFYFESLLRGRKQGLVGAELSWIEDNNKEMIKALTVLGAKKYKSYQIFEKGLA